jgi:fructose-1,6-bisphosphatase
MEKSISNLEWFGKAKFHYIVKRESYEVYRCTSIAKYQDDVIETLIDRFKADKGVVRIFCNGIEIMVLNRIKVGGKAKYH